VGGTQNVSFLGRRYFKLPILSCPRIPPATQATNIRKKSNMADSPKQKRRRVKNNKTQSLVGNFLKWCNDVGLILNDKVLLYVKNTATQYTHCLLA
jgi:hypothetical protein